MSIPDLYAEVIRGLLKKSKEKEVIWNTTTDDNTFVVFFETTSLSLKQSSDQNETWIAVNLIKNNTGDRVDGFWVSDSESDDWKTMDELFSIARRSALSIDNAITEMLTEINKGGTIGQRKKTDSGSSSNDSFIDDIPF
jgi:hypothetical protein